MKTLLDKTKEMYKQEVEELEWAIECHESLFKKKLRDKLPTPSYDIGMFVVTALGST